MAGPNTFYSASPPYWKAKIHDIRHCSCSFVTTVLFPLLPNFLIYVLPSMLKFHGLVFLELLHTPKANFLTPVSLAIVSKHVQPTPSFIAQFQTQPTSSLESVSDPNPTETITSHLQSCTNLIHLNRIHAQMIRSHVLEMPRSQFHWNSIMRSYVRLDSPLMALRIFPNMLQSGFLPDTYTLPIALKAACQVFDVVLGQQLHSLCAKCGLEHNEFCESGLICLYAKAGKFDDAHKLFGQNPERKLGSWNAIIGAFAQAGYTKQAINAFIELRKCGFAPDDVTMVSVASACGSLGDLDLGVQIHKCVFQARSLAKTDVLMWNSLVDMYGKCGRLDLAHKVFAGVVERNVSTWTSMIMGLAMHGHHEDALDFFLCMRGSGVRPNHVTFVGVLSACVHGGLVEGGRYYFSMMTDVYGLAPKLQHYGCMIDLLGRAGMLEEAREMILSMPMDANSVIWGALLGACEKHGNVEMGEWAARNLVVLEPWNDGVYVVLSNIYAGAGMWYEVERVRKLMKNKKVAKIPGYSSATIL